MRDLICSRVTTVKGIKPLVARKLSLSQTRKANKVDAHLEFDS